MTAMDRLPTMQRLRSVPILALSLCVLGSAGLAAQRAVPVETAPANPPAARGLVMVGPLHFLISE